MIHFAFLVAITWQPLPVMAKENKQLMEHSQTNMQTII